MFPALVFAGSLAAQQPEPGRTYHNEAYGYDIRYPAGWAFVEARPSSGDNPRGMGGVLLPPVLQKATFREAENKVRPGEFVVLVQEWGQGRTLEERADVSFTDVHDESLVSEVEDTKLADQAAKRFRVFGLVGCSLD
jgi:hypothetical protein